MESQGFLLSIGFSKSSSKADKELGPFGGRTKAIPLAVFYDK